MWQSTVDAEIAELFAREQTQWEVEADLLHAKRKRAGLKDRQSLNGVPPEVVNSKRTSTRARNRELRRAMSGSGSKRHA